MKKEAMKVTAAHMQLATCKAELHAMKGVLESREREIKRMDDVIRTAAAHTASLETDIAVQTKAMLQLQQSLLQSAQSESSAPVPHQEGGGKGDADVESTIAQQARDERVLQALIDSQ